MLFADSMSLLWFSYYGLSLLVLLAVYFGLAFLPRLPRLIVTWGVAGAMWMPASYRLPLVEEGEFYSLNSIMKKNNVKYIFHLAGNKEITLEDPGKNIIDFTKAILASLKEPTKTVFIFSSSYVIKFLI